jgi:hypothetical protein
MDRFYSLCVSCDLLPQALSIKAWHVSVSTDSRVVVRWWRSGKSCSVPVDPVEKLLATTATITYRSVYYPYMRSVLGQKFASSTLSLLQRTILRRSIMTVDCPPASNRAARPQKLHGRTFYESIGSPKVILAPMVDQSEFVSFSTRFYDTCSQC